MQKTQKITKQIVLTTSQLSHLFDITPQQIANWVKMGCPKISQGKYDLKAVFDWWWDHIAVDRAAGDGGKRQQGAARTVYWTAKAKKEVLLTKKLEGSMISVDAVAKGWAERWGVMMSTLEALANRLPPVLHGKSQPKMRELISDEVYDLRLQLSRHGKYTPKQKGD